MEQVKLHCEDLFVVMPKLEKKSVDLVIIDPPYGISRNKWDTKLDLEKLWEFLGDICKENAVVIFTTAEPFTSEVVSSNRKNFRYDLVWKKTIGSGQLNVAKMPLRMHENILVFYKPPIVYNEQLTEGKPYKINRGKLPENGYAKQGQSSKTNEGFRHATSVLEIANPRKKDEHPNMKPVELYEWLIRTFSNENDLVLDPCMGTGNSGLAAQQTNRKFIGVEKNKAYFDTAVEKLKQKSNKDEK